ncbi:MAG: hypothetical protein VX589_12135 [Myxococcota bacterium]|nr:hypothetical protein [Myxococcota bacterium]
MGRIIFTIAGPWSQAPDLSDEFDLAFMPGSSDFATDFIAVGQRAQSLWDEDIDAIKNHAGLIQAHVSFEAPGEHHWARKGVEFVQRAIQQGAYGVFVETGCKALSARSIIPINCTDAVSLLHFYVEVLGDASEYATEGMQAFDLPNVAAKYVDRESAQAAQGAVFALAARMVCDGLKPVDGGVFRASESAPLFSVTYAPNESFEVDDPYSNQAGRWMLSSP